MRPDDAFLAVIPLLPSMVLLIAFPPTLNDVGSTIYYSILISLIGYLATDSLIPVFSQYNLKRGLSGKDLGKKGTENESHDVPEALGIVCGIVFLVCTVVSQLSFATTDKQLVAYNSALFSVCFMTFLGFLDDSLDLKWRYKLILPTIASLPLLSAYSGSTAMYLPKPFTYLLMNEGSLTTIGTLVNVFFVVDTEAHGSILELGKFFLLFMGLQAVFCTNAINILAGINGLECGQSYVIACSLLFFKLYEILWRGSSSENEIFAVLLLMPFIGTSLALLRHNWFPAAVFVGDTFCYFAGMTFAVVGIHSHFSKTLLLLFIPQIINFLYSIPQLFKIVPCPRHRLPKIDPSTRLMSPSTFPCRSDQLRALKMKADDEECPNFTLICLVLRIFGPMNERTLCIALLTIQIAFSGLAFYIRYHLLDS